MDGAGPACGSSKSSAVGSGPVRPSASTSSTLPCATAVAPRLSESQIGFNYFFQMENLLPQEAMDSDFDGTPTDASLPGSALESRTRLLAAPSPKRSLASSLLPPRQGPPAVPPLDPAVVRRTPLFLDVSGAEGSPLSATGWEGGSPSGTAGASLQPPSSAREFVRGALCSFSGSVASEWSWHCATPQSAEESLPRAGVAARGPGLPLRQVRPLSSLRNAVPSFPRVAPVRPTASAAGGAESSWSPSDAEATGSRGVPCVGDSSDAPRGARSCSDPGPQEDAIPSVSEEAAAASAAEAVVVVASPICFPARVVMTVVMCVGACLVVVAGFTPAYIMGFRGVDQGLATHQAQAAASMLSASSAPLRQLSQVASVLRSQFPAAYVDSTEELPLSSDQTIAAMSSVLARPLLRHMVGAVQFTHVGPQGEWRTIASALHPTDAAAGAVLSPRTRGSNAMAPYHLHPEPQRTQRADEPTPTCDSGLPEATDGAHSPATDVVPRWGPTGNRSLQTSPRMCGGGDDAPHLDLVVPLQGVDGAGGRLGVRLRSTRAAPLVGRWRTHGSRAKGLFFALDPSTNRVVVNSWNQSLSERPGGDGYEAALRVEDVASPLAVASLRWLREMGLLGSPRELLRTAGSHVRRRFRYGRDAAWVHAYNDVREDVAGLSLVYVVVTLESDYHAPAYRIRTAALGMMTAILCVIFACSYLLASYVVRSLSELVTRLVSNKSLPSSGGTELSEGQPSIFTELACVELAYAQLQRQLLARTTAEPEGLQPSTAESDAAAVNAPLDASIALQSDCGTRGVARRDGALSSSAAADGAGADGMVSCSQSEVTSVLVPSTRMRSMKETLRLSRRWRQDMRLNTKMFNEQVNAYQRRYCSLLFVCRYYTHEVKHDVLNRYFAACYAAVVGHNGCLEFLRPDYAVASFAAHTQMPMHATRACQCALAIYNALPPGERDAITYVIDSNEFLVGTCGVANGKKGRVVFDVMHLMSLSRVCRAKGYIGVMATQSAASHLPDYQSVPVDCVLEEVHATACVICEIRETPTGANLVELAHTAKQFRQAFHYMMKGLYRKALRLYRRIGPADATAARLASSCLQRIARGDQKGLLTVCAPPQMLGLARVLQDKNLVPFLRVQKDYLLRLLGGEPVLGPRFTGTTSEGAAVGRGSPSRQGFGLGSTDAAPAATAAASGAPAVDPTARSAADPNVRSPGGDGDVVGSAHSSDDEGGLLNWIDVQSSGSSYGNTGHGMPRDESSRSTMGVESLVFIDESDRRWSRSIESIGVGAFSVVYLGMSEDGVQAAIKCIPRRRRDIKEDHVRLEMKTMAELRHPNIVQYIGFCASPSHLSIIMEYVPGGSLSAFTRNFGRLDATVARRFLLDILSGLAYLHARNIVHCDVKPHNVLLGMDGICKLSDFGSTLSEATDVARSSGEEPALRGTPLYMAPEVARGERCTPQSDVYSLGVSLLEMLLGRPSWTWANSVPAAGMQGPPEAVCGGDARFVQLLSRGDIVPCIPETLDREVYSFCQACCQADPSKRPTAQELMSFPFIL